MRRRTFGGLLLAGFGTAGCAPGLEFTLPDLDGNLVSPSSGAVVVLAFWATWCKPCQLELAEMNDMYLRLHLKGLELYAISVDKADAQDRVEAWVRSNAYAFPVLLDPRSKLFGRYNPSATIPYLTVFDDAGERIETRRGYEPGGVADLEAYLRRQLSEPASAPS